MKQKFKRKCGKKWGPIGGVDEAEMRANIMNDEAESSQYRIEIEENVVKSRVQLGSKWGRRGSRWRLGARGQK